MVEDGEAETVGFKDEEDAANNWKTRAWKGKGIDVLWFGNLDHAQVFDKPATRRPIISAIRAYCKKGDARI